MGACLDGTICYDKATLTLESLSKRSISSMSESSNIPVTMQESLEDLKARIQKEYEIVEIKEASKFQRPMITRAMTFISTSNDTNNKLSQSADENKFPIKRSNTKTNSGLRLSFLKKAKEKMRNSTFKPPKIEIFKEESISEESTGVLPLTSRDEGYEKWKEDFNFLHRPKGDYDPIVFK
ncbi:hypothetical protein SteCoe_31043 [Stentor coeruleus]|uniref:Uncharacterized protein n=1 Tax=Stentor coeruleus TaxID=5963 RepID=A0A1R2B278_9CILI|nr:hypothetical protein SteCoe_31043 [Stentor coeruleus]